MFSVKVLVGIVIVCFVVDFGFADERDTISPSLYCANLNPQNALDIKQVCLKNKFIVKHFLK